MSVDRTRVYDSASDFFAEGGSVVMKLTPLAAIDVCKQAASHSLIVVRVEGGILHHPGFEARLDCIWDSKIDPPVDQKIADKSNMLAIEFIKSESDIHDAFIITSSDFRGHPS